MNATTLPFRKVSILLCALAIPMGLAAENHANKAGHHHYKLVDLGTLGGPSAYKSLNAPGYQILSDNGEIAFGADTPVVENNAPNCFQFDCFVSHATRWKNGVLTDLGALPGAENGGQSSAINARGWIVGGSENGAIDPITGFREWHATLWRHDQIIDLGTFGGQWSDGVTLNDAGVVVGWASNSVPDTYPLFPGFSVVGTQIRAFLWENGVLSDLGTLGGDDAQALSLNQRGQVIGISYTDRTANVTTGIPTVHPFLYEEGRMTDLGTLGGTYAGPGSCNFGANCTSAIPFYEGALLINNRGQVIGTSNLAGDQVFHPFLWKHGKMRDLGTLGGANGVAIWLTDDGEVVGQADVPGSQAHHGFRWKDGVMTDLGTLGTDPCSRAVMANSRGQVIGSTIAICGQGETHAFLWENGGPMADLNSLSAAAASGVNLFEADNINERGEIVVQGLPKGCNDPSSCQHLYLLIPCDEIHGDIEGCDYAPMEASAVATLSSTQALPAAPENTPVRQLLLRQLGFARFTGSVFPVTSDAPFTSGPSATVSPASLTFSTQALGTTSAAETVALKNTGTTSLTISVIAITGTDPADFAQTHTCGSSLAAGASCSISITFRPTASGTRTAILSVTDNAAGNPQKTSLAGIGTTATLPASLGFGTVAIGVTSPAQTATLANVGTTALTVTGIAITGINAGDFSQTHNCASSLAAGASCSISVTFRPTASGTRTAILSVTDNAAGSPQKVNLVGIGTTARLSPTSLYFGAVPILATSPARTVTLTNVGTTALTVSGIAITGTNAGDFKQTHNCASSLPAGASCNISVTFRPTASGTRTAILSVTDNAAGSPQKVGLGGGGGTTTGGCIPIGHICYGPGPNRCCRAPYPHHSFCGNPTGWGTCQES